MSMSQQRHTIPEPRGASNLAAEVGEYVQCAIRTGAIDSGRGQSLTIELYEYAAAILPSIGRLHCQPGCAFTTHNHAELVLHRLNAGHHRRHVEIFVREDLDLEAGIYQANLPESIDIVFLLVASTRAVIVFQVPPFEWALNKPDVCRRMLTEWRLIQPKEVIPC